MAMAVPASKVKVEAVPMDVTESNDGAASFTAIMGSNQVASLGSLENISEFELSSASGDAGKLPATNQRSLNQMAIINNIQNSKGTTLGNNVQILTGSMQGSGNSAHTVGAQVQTLKPQQLMQSVVKKPITITPGSAGGQTVTKVILTKNPNNLGQQHQSFATLTSSQSGATPIFVSMPSGTQIASLSQPAQFIQSSTPLFVSPTKSSGLGTHSLILSPTKLVGGNATTPTKQIMPANKLPISPVKTPTKITVIPGSSVARSGQNIMFTKTLGADSGSADFLQAATGKGPTITMSPSKLTMRPQLNKQVNQQVTKNTIVAQQLNPSLRQPVAIGNTSVHPVSVAGSKFQYVRLVTTSQAGSQSNLKPTTIAGLSSLSAKPIAPAGGLTTGSHGAPMKITMSVPQSQQPHHQQQLQQQHSLTSQSQRLLLPATSQVAIRPAPSAPVNIRPAGTITQLPPGTTIISSGQNFSGVQGFALVPAQYVSQLQQISQPQVGLGRQDLNFQASSSSNGMPAPPKHTGRASSAAVAAAAETGGPGQRPRKPCNCTKSQCLKLYCDCFANGEFCYNCNCNNCYNNLDHEEERSRAVKACLDRNPYAFHPKIGKETGGGRKHNKGCNCKRSGCLKNYCECYEAKILCSGQCKCIGCKNFEESPERKTLMDLAQAADVRVQQQAAAKTKLSSQIDLPSRPPAPSTGERLPYTFITQDVIEATCNCLLAQAEEAERTQQREELQERMLLQEFGRCLSQIIQSANKTRAPSPPQD